MRQLNNFSFFVCVYVENIDFNAIDWSDIFSETRFLLNSLIRTFWKIPIALCYDIERPLNTIQSVLELQFQDFDKFISNY